MTKAQSKGTKSKEYQIILKSFYMQPLAAYECAVENTNKIGVQILLAWYKFTVNNE